MQLYALALLPLVKKADEHVFNVVNNIEYNNVQHGKKSYVRLGI